MQTIDLMQLFKPHTVFLNSCNHKCSTFFFFFFECSIYILCLKSIKCYMHKEYYFTIFVEIACSLIYLPYTK